MADFDAALTHTLRFEGGYVHDPRDAGGRTYAGISETAHPDAWKDGSVGEAEARQVYRHDYWDALHLDLIASQGLANEVFDFAVTSGADRAATYLQQAWNAIRQSYEDPLVEDGIVGPMTRSAANEYERRYPGVLHRAYAVKRGAFYLSLNRPTFVRGWMKRVFA